MLRPERREDLFEADWKVLEVVAGRRRSSIVYAVLLFWKRYVCCVRLHPRSLDLFEQGASFLCNIFVRDFSDGLFRCTYKN